MGSLTGTGQLSLGLGGTRASSDAKEQTAGSAAPTRALRRDVPVKSEEKPPSAGEGSTAKPPALAHPAALQEAAQPAGRAAPAPGSQPAVPADADAAGRGGPAAPAAAEPQASAKDVETLEARLASHLEELEMLDQFAAEMDDADPTSDSTGASQAG